MFDGDDVINVMGFRGVVLMYEAVFATPLRSFNHLPAKLVGNVNSRHGNFP